MTKIISLNIWGGRIGDSLFEFFRRNSEIEIFLLQEVFDRATSKTNWHEHERPDLFQEIRAVLPNHQAYFAPSVFDEWGLAAFIHDSIQIEEAGNFFVHKTKHSLLKRDANSIGRNLQYQKVILDAGRKINVLNFHGIWDKNGKTDSPERLEQSKKIGDFVKALPNETILAGDFNLLPDTESIRMIERNFGLKNLILEYGIASTRTSLYTKPHKFADYVFVSPSLPIKTFQILPDEVSDHAALLLELG